MAIIGRGDIASVLPERDILYFASGVSNSQETDEAQYYRELELLRKQPRGSHIVYFSTLALFYSDTRYTRHKLMMERFVQREFRIHTIVRLGNILWGTNPHTLINYLKAHPKAEIRDEYRYIVDKNEFLYWVDMIPDWSVEMNITGRRLKIKEIYEQYVKPHLKKVR